MTVSIHVNSDEKKWNQNKNIFGLPGQIYACPTMAVYLCISLWIKIQAECLYNKSYSLSVVLGISVFLLQAKASAKHTEPQT